MNKYKLWRLWFYTIVATLTLSIMPIFATKIAKVSAQSSIISTNVISNNLTNQPTGGAPGELTPDGRFVLISSSDRTLVGGSVNDPGAGYILDRQIGGIQELAHSVDAQPVNNYVQAISITPDGRYVVIASRASNIYPNVSGQFVQVYVIDRQTGTISLASMDNQGNIGNDHSSTCAEHQISDDGRYVLFYSDATNLVPDDNNGVTDVFVKDMQTQLVERVSISSNGTEANDQSNCASISGDGRYVAFVSRATNLTLDGSNQAANVYLRDRNSTTTRLISVTPNGGRAIGDCLNPSMTGAGDKVTFDCYAGTVFSSNQDTANSANVYMWSGNDSSITPISVTTDGEPVSKTSGGGANNVNARISYDGRLVAFQASAGVSDIWVHDNTDGGNTQMQRNSNPLGSISQQSYVQGPGMNGQYFVVWQGADNNIGGQAWLSELAVTGPDTTQPTITYSVAPSVNSAGWSNSNVTVTFTCNDTQSGIQSCSQPVNVSAEGANQTVTGTAVDNAGNTATVTATINLDKTAPVITTSLSQAPNAASWSSGPVTVSYSCSDALSGLLSCSTPQTESNDGVYDLQGSGTDNAGNTKVANTTINIDQTAPTVGTATWGSDPLALGQNTTLTVPASDNLSGVTAGEYFIGSDPGQGNGTAFSYSGGNLSASFGSNLGVGVYNVGFRSKDAAGNWSSTGTTILAVYDSSSSTKMTGRNRRDLIPSLTNGDVLPGLIASNQTDAADYGFTVEYKNGVLDTHNDFLFNYTTGTNCGKANAQNCHSFNLNANSIAWLVIDQTNSSRGRFQGTATVTVDGVTTTNPFTVEGIDGDRLTPTADDHLTLKVYTSGADPSTATPIYQASGSMAKGTAVKIQ